MLHGGNTRPDNGGADGLASVGPTVTTSSALCEGPETPTTEVRDLIGLRAAHNNYEVLRNALHTPITKLRGASLPEARELGFVQATIVALLELEEYKLLDQLADEGRLHRLQRRHQHRRSFSSS